MISPKPKMPKKNVDVHMRSSISNNECLYTRLMCRDVDTFSLERITFGVSPESGVIEYCRPVLLDRI